jgi:hypothetical protein
MFASTGFRKPAHAASSGFQKPFTGAMAAFGKVNINYKMFSQEQFKKNFQISQERKSKINVKTISGSTEGLISFLVTKK